MGGYRGFAIESTATETSTRKQHTVCARIKPHYINDTHAEVRNYIGDITEYPCDTEEYNILSKIDSVIPNSGRGGMYAACLHSVYADCNSDINCDGFMIERDGRRYKLFTST